MSFMEFVPAIAGAASSILGAHGKRRIEENAYKNGVVGAKAASTQQAPGRGIMSGIFQAHGLVSPEQRKAMSAAAPIPEYNPSGNFLTDVAGGLEQFGANFPKAGEVEPYDPAAARGEYGTYATPQGQTVTQPRLSDDMFNDLLASLMGGG